METFSKDLALIKPLSLGPVTLLQRGKILIHRPVDLEKLDLLLQFAGKSKAIRKISGSPTIDLTLKEILKKLISMEQDDWREAVEDFLSGLSRLSLRELTFQMETVLPPREIDNRKPLELLLITEYLAEVTNLPSPLSRLEAAALVYREEELLKRLEHAVPLIENERTRSFGLDRFKESGRMLKLHLKERRPNRKTTQFLEGCMMPVEVDGALVPLRDLF